MSTDCDCPKFVARRREANGALAPALINHTYECLVEQRGDKTLEQHYGAVEPRR
jgi:hypothetical protein